MTSLTKDQKLAKQQDELHDLQSRQREGKVGKIQANKNKNFEISELEAKDYVHVATTTKHVDTNKKEVNLEKAVITIHATEFDRRVKEGAFATYDGVEVIHDPRPNAPATYSLKPSRFDQQAKTDDKALDRVRENYKKQVEELAAKEEDLARRAVEMEEKAKRLEELEARLEEKLTADEKAQAKQKK